ncbi:MAG TPA: hypothetical protein VG899_13515 [Mycobacteriales bacterium]|nr:hypothetical protein [Mycobacteriales bacterium]
MPLRCDVDPRLPGLIAYQDHVVHRAQALEHGLTQPAIGYRLRRELWRPLLPEVYLTHPGEASWRQMLIAAVLFAGPASAIDGADACRFHGVQAVAVDQERVQVVVPYGEPVRSRGFVVVRRTLAPFDVVSTGVIRYVEPATAVVAATRRMRQSRLVLAAFSDAVQRRVTTVDDLCRAHVQGPPRNSRFGDQALAALASGIRSVPEADFRRLADASAVLPQVEYNVWLRLACGRVVCVDALIADSGVVHETNGRSAHAREDLFEDLQERHDALTTSGLIVLHNPPRRLREHPREVVAQVERCHARYAGRGLPSGVTRLRWPSENFLGPSDGHRGVAAG